VHLSRVETAETVLDEKAASRLAMLYERHVPRAVALARLLTDDDHLAEDVAHDAFIRAAGRFAKLRRPEAFDAYLRKAVVNTCRAGWRRARVEREWLRRQTVSDIAELPPFGPDERTVLWRAIANLPWRQRAAVVLRYYEDLPHEQIGELLRCSTGAVESLLSRAMSTLRKLIDREDLR
jgi:RNA polymerase sigma-70 factor (sigma-E family)